MYRKELLILLGVSILIAFIASGLLLKEGWRPQWPFKKITSSTEETPIKYIKSSMAMDFGNGEMQEHVNIDVPEGITAFQFLKNITTHNKLALKYELGSQANPQTKITAIGKIQNSAEGSWRYLINEAQPTEDIQKYIMLEGDRLDLRFEKE